MAKPHNNTQDIKECVSYQGPVKTVQEMDSDVALAAAREFFAQLAPAERLLSEELLNERREEEK